MFAGPNSSVNVPRTPDGCQLIGLRNLSNNHSVGTIPTSPSTLPLFSNCNQQYLQHQFHQNLSPKSQSNQSGILNNVSCHSTESCSESVVKAQSDNSISSQPLHLTPTSTQLQLRASFKRWLDSVCALTIEEEDSICKASAAAIALRQIQLEIQYNLFLNCPRGASLNPEDVLKAYKLKRESFYRRISSRNNVSCESPLKNSLQINSSTPIRRTYSTCASPNDVQNLNFTTILDPALSPNVQSSNITPASISTEPMNCLSPIEAESDWNAQHSSGNQAYLNPQNNFISNNDTLKSSEEPIISKHIKMGISSPKVSPLVLCKHPAWSAKLAQQLIEMRTNNKDLISYSEICSSTPSPPILMRETDDMENYKLINDSKSRTLPIVDSDFENHILLKSFNRFVGNTLSDGEVEFQNAKLINSCSETFAHKEQLIEDAPRYFKRQLESGKSLKIKFPPSPTRKYSIKSADQHSLSSEVATPPSIDHNVLSQNTPVYLTQLPD